MTKPADERKRWVNHIPLIIRKVIYVICLVVWLIISIPFEGFYKEDWREIWPR